MTMFGIRTCFLYLIERQRDAMLSWLLLLHITGLWTFCLRIRILRVMERSYAIILSSLLNVPAFCTLAYRQVWFQFCWSWNLESDNVNIDNFLWCCWFKELTMVFFSFLVHCELGRVMWVRRNYTHLSRLFRLFIHFISLFSVPETMHEYDDY